MSVGPAILLLVTTDAPRDQIAAFCLGCEEEGVPIRVEPGHGAADTLARQAAERSGFGVGAGVAGRTVVVHERRLAERSLGLQTTRADESTSRLLGANAARIVKQRPLRGLAPDESRC